MRIFIVRITFIFIIVTSYNSNVLLLLFKYQYKSSFNIQSVECFTVQSKISILSTSRQNHQHRILPVQVLEPVLVGQYEILEQKLFVKRKITTEHFVLLLMMMTMNNEDVIISWELDVAKRIRQEVKKKRMNEKQQESLSSSSSSSSPYMVGIIGIPGSGKTTGAQILLNLLMSNNTSSSSNNDTDNTPGSNGSYTDDNDIGNGMILPFDGYHIPLKELNNNADLIYRRGAPDTFDLQRFSNDLSRIRYNNNNTNETIILLPSFSHSIGDPEYDTILFNRTIHNIVICEGLYLLHNDNDNGWDKIKSFFDLCIYIDSNIDLCMDRLKVRNLQIPGYTPEEIIQRVNIVDRTNALLVEQSRSRADLFVQSVTSSSSSSTSEEITTSTG